MPMKEKAPLLFPDYAQFDFDLDYTGINKTTKKDDSNPECVDL